MAKVSNLQRSFMDWGVPDTVSRLTWMYAMNMFGLEFHKNAVPSLSTLCKSASVVSDEPSEFVKTVFTEAKSRIEELHREYQALKTNILRRYEDRTLPFPRVWAVEEKSGFMLYATVRLMKPEIVLETGVANGHSSLLITSALMRNGSGMLHSVDVRSDAGALLDEEERNYWQFHLLLQPVTKKKFHEIVEELPPIDLMLQDSDHSYRWTHFELEAVLPKMSDRGVFLCDDTDLSYAVIDFAKEKQLSLSLLVDTRKVFGLVTAA